MNDYKELIGNLRYFAGACNDAADAIEQLVTELDAVRKERDAAIKDLHGYCWCCTKVKQSCFPTNNEDCKNWEWKGVQE